MGVRATSPCAKASAAFPDLVPQEELDKTAKYRLFSSRPKVGRWSSRQATPPTSSGPRFGMNPKTTILAMQDLHTQGDLFVNYLRARHEVFVHQKGWDLPEVDGMEFDQYDTPLARWIVIHKERSILAGIRITPTTAHCGLHSYMLRDAQLGLIPGLPGDALFQSAPVSPEIWEATRLFLSKDVPSSQRADVQTQLMKGMAEAAMSVGARKVIGIVPAVFRRWLKRIGMEAEAVGPVMKIDGDRVQAAIMDIEKVATGALSSKGSNASAFLRLPVTSSREPNALAS